MERKKFKRIFFNIFFDLGSIFLCLILLSFIKYIDKIDKLDDFYLVYGFYGLLILLFSFLFDKYEVRRKYGYYRILNKYFLAWILGTSVFFIVFFWLESKYYYEWTQLLITFFSIFLFELLLVSIRFSFRYAKFVGDRMELVHSILMKETSFPEEIKEEIEEENMEEQKSPNANLIADLLPLEAITNKQLRKIILKFASPEEKHNKYLHTKNRQVVRYFKNHSLELIVNTSIVNRLRYMNKFHELVNLKLKKNGFLIVCVETLEQRKSRHKNKYPGILFPFYQFFEFIVHRVWPRMPYLRKSYYWFWKNNSKRISYAETLGRLYSCGFEYVDAMNTEGLAWIVVKKVKPPLLSFDVTYSPIIKLKRIGKNGKMISVYKMRTMHPYSEFLQEYIFKTNQLAEGGKFKDDFRVSVVGRLMRKFWLDELPMIMNLLKGELKLVGVRPLSKHYFSLYPEELRIKRIQVKPGLIPPFYYDMPKTFDEIIASERKYLEKYEKSPILTDWKYFWKAFSNILFKKARSK